jgi:hypothetical protein
MRPESASIPRSPAREIGPHTTISPTMSEPVDLGGYSLLCIETGRRSDCRGELKVTQQFPVSEYCQSVEIGGPGDDQLDGEYKNVARQWTSYAC